jgi:hypothetical protein
VGSSHCHGSEGIHLERILKSARVVWKGRYHRYLGYWKEGWHSGRADCQVLRNCYHAWVLSHAAEVIVEEQISGDCALVFARVLAYSLLGILV